MFKWIEKKLIERIVKDIAKELPGLKEKALILLQEKRDYLIEQAKEAAKAKILELVKKL